MCLPNQHADLQSRFIDVTFKAGIGDDESDIVDDADMAN